MTDAVCSRCGEPLGPAGGVYTDDVRGVPDVCRPCHARMSFDIWWSARGAGEPDVANDKCAAWLADGLRKRVDLPPGMVTFHEPFRISGAEGLGSQCLVAFSSRWTMLCVGDSFHLCIFAEDGSLNLLVPSGRVEAYVRVPDNPARCINLDACFEETTTT